MVLSKFLILGPPDSKPISMGLFTVITSTNHVLEIRQIALSNAIFYEESDYYSRFGF